MNSTTAAIPGDGSTVRPRLPASSLADGPRLKMPTWLVGGVFGLCLLPMVLNAIGIQFDLTVDPDRVLGAGNVNDAYQALAGTYVHSLLE